MDELSAKERGVAGLVGLVIMVVAIGLLLQPPGHRVALDQCPTAAAGCIVTVDQDLSTFASILAGLGALAMLIALLGRRFSTLKLGGNELSHTPSTVGLSEAPPATRSAEDVPDGSAPPVEKLSPAPITVTVEAGKGTTTRTAPVAVARLVEPMRDVEPSVLRDYQSARKETQRRHFLTHSLGPARHANQSYSVAIRVTTHKDAATSVKSARFFLGRAWGNRVFEASPGLDGRFGITTEAYGPFLALCDVEFEDGERILLDHYCDFDMGDLVPGVAVNR